jgi:glycosyltransferase involved in cell wall biosynthesis
MMIQDPRVNSSNPTRLARCLIIVPAKNERESINLLVKQLIFHLPECDVLIVDDGSTDGAALEVPPQAKVVKLPFNLGIGGAMQTGYRYADIHGYELAVQVDGDGQHRASEVRKLLEHLLTQQADMIVGSRFMETAGAYRQTIGRAVGGWILSSLLKILTGQRFTDCTSGFRAVNKRVIQAFADWYPEDYPEPEVILLLHRSGFTLGEVPVLMRRRQTGTSSISTIKGVYYIIKVSTCLVLDMLRSPWSQPQIAVAP